MLLLSFEAPEPLLRALVSPTVELDRWCGRTYVSLVALRMAKVRVLGVPLPGLTGHPQVNFRTYVRYRGEPGVWFLRVLVPSRWIAAAAHLGYGEPCGTIAIRAAVEEDGTRVRAAYRIGRAELGWHVRAAGCGPNRLPPEGSVERYFTERAVACRARRDKRLELVRVAHPPWATREVQELDYAVDFARLYGAAWEFLNGARPHSVIFAVGSDVVVSPATLAR